MEFGVQWKNGEYSIQGALFNSQVKNLIVNRQLGDNIQQLQNVGEANFYGIELDYRYMGNQSGVNFNYTFLRAFNQSDNRESDFIEYRPKHRLNLLWHYNI